MKTAYKYFICLCLIISSASCSRDDVPSAVINEKDPNGFEVVDHNCIVEPFQFVGDKVLIDNCYLMEKSSFNELIQKSTAQGSAPALCEFNYDISIEVRNSALGTPETFEISFEQFQNAANAWTSVAESGINFTVYEQGTIENPDITIYGDLDPILGYQNPIYNINEWRDPYDFVSSNTFLNYTCMLSTYPYNCKPGPAITIDHSALLISEILADLSTWFTPLSEAEITDMISHELGHTLGFKHATNTFTANIDPNIPTEHNVCGTTFDDPTSVMLSLACSSPMPINFSDALALMKYYPTKDAYHQPIIEVLGKTETSTGFILDIGITNLDQKAAWIEFEASLYTENSETGQTCETDSDKIIIGAGSGCPNPDGVFTIQFFRGTCPVDDKVETRHKIWVAGKHKNVKEDIFVQGTLLIDLDEESDCCGTMDLFK